MFKSLKSRQGIMNEPRLRARLPTHHERVDVSALRVCERRVIISKCGLAFTDTLISSVISPQLRLMQLTPTDFMTNNQKRSLRYRKNR